MVLAYSDTQISKPSSPKLCQIIAFSASSPSTDLVCAVCQSAFDFWHATCHFVHKSNAPLTESANDCALGAKAENTISVNGVAMSNSSVNNMSSVIIL